MLRNIVVSLVEPYYYKHFCKMSNDKISFCLFFLYKSNVPQRLKAGMEAFQEKNDSKNLPGR